MIPRLITAFSIIFFLSTCVEDETKQPNDAEKYLNELLDIMEQNSIHKNTIDWPDFRAKVFVEAPEAQTIPETYLAIKKALAMLDDNNHSSFIKPTGSFIFGGPLPCDAQIITSPTLPANVGYVRVGEFSEASTTAAISFAQGIQNQIRNQDKNDLLGWIVDARSNLGGNMWPMVAGIGPILGEGTAGYFIDADGNESSWSYSDGASKLNGVAITRLSNPYKVIVPSPRVAVLLDNGTASSGEAFVISFIGRENTKSFGMPTCGLSTANVSFNLSDNAVLLLTTSYLADRNKNLFGIPIAPDIPCNDDMIIQNAVDWIQN